MEWIEILRKSIDFLEQHLLEGAVVENVAKEVYLSTFYFQKGFKLITGYTIGEYVRNRRLYLAALEVNKGNERVIDVAYKYGYDTPESFTKAFTRFHGISPMKMKEKPDKINVFHPLQISISIRGGNKIDYRIEEEEAFKVIGLERTFQYDRAFVDIPKFWEAYNSQYAKKYCSILTQSSLDVYGISIDQEMKGKMFSYLIAGIYKENEDIILEELKVTTIPALTWAKFRCIGPMPQALQALNTRIFNEWLPGNSDYKIGAGYNIEMYPKGDIHDRDYVSEIWIPVKKK
ncbi:AraC family transcriptional regulator [Crassaminicella profunda]|uniref:AraC family transcriptional regulator n=1 Tax=Crassaminicella profunda TaxID=1286698 RepID=UPI001CA62BED|nr:AraC family transcriptional regulator [Crassaminicella profunda]QZY54965.1 AraC family transcriptional regulator [Crassaminicella profunda]